MLEQIEKIFPGFLRRLRRLPFAVRAVLLVAVLASAPTLTWIYGHQAALSAWLQQELRAPLYLLILAAVGCGILPVAVSWLACRTRTQRDIRRFLADWLQFKEQFTLLCLRIDGYLLKDREATGLFGELDDLLPFIREDWHLRGRLREDIFRVGENQLASLHSARRAGLLQAHRRAPVLYGGRRAPLETGALLDGHENQGP